MHIVNISQVTLFCTVFWAFHSERKKTHL